MGRVRGRVLIRLLTAAALVAGVAQVGALAEPSGPPLTKDEYAMRATKIDGRAELIVSRHFYPLTDADPPPRKRCAREIRLLPKRLAGPLASAQQIKPPVEIASIHDQIVLSGRRVLRVIGKPARPLAKGKIDCAEAGSRVTDRYLKSPLEGLEQELYDRGYLLGGY